MDDLLLVFVVLVFVAAFLFIERILSLIVGPQRVEARRFKKRLQVISDSQKVGNASLLLNQVGLDSKDSGAWDSGKISWRLKLNQRLRGAGYKISLAKVAMVCIASGIVSFAVFSYLIGPLLAAIVALVVTVALPIKISLDYNKRMRQFEEGLVEALDVMTRSLRAGQPFNEAMLMVAQELHGPVSEEFGLTFAELNYGLSPKQAFENMLQRVPSMTLKALVVAVLLQRETGGNLAELLEKINSVLRGRFRFNRKVRTVTAEGRLSAVILTLVPFVLFGMIHITTPGYVAELINNPDGHRLIAISAVLMIIGIFWVRKLTKIDV